MMHISILGLNINVQLLRIAVKIVKLILLHIKYEKERIDASLWVQTGTNI